MQWCRLYKEFASDAKVQALSYSNQRHLIMLFCLHINDEINGLTEVQIRKYLGVRVQEFARIKKLFLESNFIDENWKLNQWSKRQFSRDDSNARVARHREKKKQECNASVTQCNGYSNAIVTPPESESETDKDLIKNQSYPQTPFLSEQSSEKPSVDIFRTVGKMNTVEKDGIDGWIDNFIYEEAKEERELIKSYILPLAERYPEMYQVKSSLKFTQMFLDWVTHGCEAIDVRESLRQFGSVAKSPMYFEHVVPRIATERYMPEYKASMSL